jgi:ankyrin repeat protein
MSELRDPHVDEPPLHRAARLGDHAAIVSLLDQGADINALHNYGIDPGAYPFYATPLIVAAGSADGASTETLNLLVERGADISFRTRWWGSAASAAAASLGWGHATGGDADRLRFLLEHGADPNETTGNGASLLAQAAGIGDSRRVQLLIELGAEVQPTKAPEPPPLDPREPEYVPSPKAAAMRDQVETIMAELDCFDDGGDLVPLREEGDLPSSYQIPLFAAVESGSVECVDLLLAAGADPNFRESWGSVPVMSATTPDVLRALIQAGADLGAVTKFGDDPFDKLVIGGGREDPEHDIVALGKVLIEAGVDPFKKNRAGWSKIDMAAFNWNPKAVRFLLGLGASLAASPSGTPLHKACWQGEYSDPDTTWLGLETIDVLVEAGVDLEARDEHGETAMHEAASGDWGFASGIRRLLQHGAKPDPIDLGGVTPLMLAASMGELACVKLLLDAGADPTRKDTKGRTALDAARSHRRSWRSIAKKPPDLGFTPLTESPDETNARHQEVLRNAEESFDLIQAAIKAKKRR